MSRTHRAEVGRFRIALLLGVCAWACTGCAYFRWGQKTTVDEKQAQEDQEKIKNQWFPGGTVFNSPSQ